MFIGLNVLPNKDNDSVFSLIPRSDMLNLYLLGREAMGNS
jgi:hypothetical protein